MIDYFTKQNLWRTCTKMSKLLPLLTIGILASTASMFAQVSLTASGGTTTGSFTTLNAAFTAINAGTHTGAINITITGNTTEPATPVPLNFSGSGAALYSSISIKPSGGSWTVNGNALPTANRGTIEFNSADNVTIDGDDPLTAGDKNLSFVNPVSATITAVIKLGSQSTAGNGCNNVTIKNCNITGSRNSSVSTTTNIGIVLMGSSTTSLLTQGFDHDNITIENNNITRAYYGIYTVGQSSNISTSAFDNLVIRKNTIGSSAAGQGVGLYGIYLQGTSSSVPSTSTGALITNNDIRVGNDGINSLTTYSSTLYGILITSNTSSTIIERNNIHDMYQPTTGTTTGVYGIGINNSTFTQNILIKNNFIRDMVAPKIQNTNAAAFTNIYGSYGIYVTAGAENLRVINNTIALLQNPIAGTGTNWSSAPIYFVSTTGNLREVRNNIFVNNQTSPTHLFNGNPWPQTWQGIVTTGLASQFANAQINHNNYFSTFASAGVGVGIGFGFFNYAAWVGNTPGSGFDANGKNLNPNFTSTTDLHISLAGPNAPNMNDVGSYSSLVENDIDNDNRDAATPDIGADEYNVTLCNLSTSGTIVQAGTSGIANACINTPIILNDTGYTTGGGKTFQWVSGTSASGPWTNITTPGSGFNTPNYNSVTPFALGTYYFRCIVTCTSTGISDSTAPVTVVVNGIPNVSASSPTSPAYICVGAGQSVVLNAASTDPTTPSFTWSPAIGLNTTSGASVFASPTETSIYIVTAIDANGCTNTSSISVGARLSPSVVGVTAYPSANICNGASAGMKVTTGPNGSPLILTELCTNYVTTNAVTPQPTWMTNAVGAGDIFELSNIGITPLDISGYKFSIYTVNTATTPNFEFTFPTGTIIPPNSPVVIGGSGFGTTVNNVFYNWASYSNPLSSGSVCGFVIRDSNNVIFDAVGFNNFQFIAANQGVTPLMWNNGNVGAASGTSGYRRTVAVDNNVHTDWTVANATTNKINYGVMNLSYPAAGSLTGYDWQLSSDLGGANNTDSVYTSTLLASSSIFTVTVANSLGCTASSTLAINIAGTNGSFTANPLVLNPLSGSVCAGLSLNIKDTVINGGSPYSWELKDPLGNPIYTTSTALENFNYSFIPSLSGDYSLTVTDACNSVQVVTASILVAPAPTVSITTNASLYCSGSTPISATASGSGVSYTWAPGSLTGAMVNLTPNADSVVYTVTSSDAIGCTATSTVKLYREFGPTILSLSATPASVCLNGNATIISNSQIIQGGPQTIPTGYGPSSATNPADDEIAGILIRDTTIVPFDTLVYNFSPTPCTYTGASTITNGLPPSVVALYNNFTNLPIKTMTAGKTYQFRMFLTNCGTFAFSMSQNCFIDLNRNGLLTDANERLIASAATVAGGLMPNPSIVTYNVTIPATATPGKTLMRFIVNENGVGATQAPTGTYIYGETEDYIVDIIAAAPVPSAQITWSPTTYLTPTTGASVLASNMTTSEIYTVTASSASGLCIATSSVAVNVGATLSCNPIVATGVNSLNAVCANLSAKLKASISGGGAPFTYNWASSNSANLSSADSIVVTNNPIGAETYTLTVTDNCGQTCTQTYTLLTEAIPTIVNGGNQLICGPLGSATISFNSTNSAGNYSYSVMPGSFSNASVSGTQSITVSPSATTNYTISIVDGTTGCTNTNTIVVTRNTIPAFDSAYANPANICTNGISILYAGARSLTAGPQTIPTGYGTSNATSINDDEIAAVVLRDITPAIPDTILNNTSTCLTTGGGAANGLPASSINLYSNYSNINITKPLLGGSTYQITMRLTNCSSVEYSMGQAVWIDFNRNGTFEAGEKVVASAGTNQGLFLSNTTPSLVTYNFTVPTTATPGRTLMRCVVVESNNGTAINPTGTYTWGETEDYIVDIIAAGPSAITWSGASLSSTTGNSVTAGPLTSSQVYTVTASSTGGCTTTTTISLNVGAVLSCGTISSNIGNSICQNAATTLSVLPIGGGAPFNYTWQDAAGNTVGTNSGTITVNPSATGVYSVTIADDCGQTCQTTISITVNPAPSVNATSSTSLLCDSGSAVLSATGSAATWAWMPGAGSGASYTVSPNVTTTYTLTGTDAIGCTATTTVLVNFGNAPANVSVIANPSSICANGTTTLTGSALVLGTGPQTLPSVNSYNAAGATPVSTADDEIARVQIVGTPLNNVSSCSTTGSASAINTLPASILNRYANYTNLPAPTLVSGTTYTVNMDLTYCSGTAYSMGYAVFMDLNRNGVWDMPAERVYGSPLTVNSFGGPLNFPVNFTITIPTSATAGVTLMRVSAYENAAGSAFLPTAASSGWGEVEDYQVNIISQVPMAGSGLSYGPSMDLATTTGMSVTTNSLAAGTYTFTVTATDASGCTATGTTTVVSGSALINGTPTVSSSTLCVGQSSVITANATGGGLPYTHTWSDASGVISSSATTSVSPLASTTYTYVVTDACGQSVSGTVAIVVNNLPEVTTSTSNTLICNTGSSTLMAGGANSYTWMPGAAAGSTYSVSPAITTTYTVTGTDMNGCTNTSTVVVNFGNSPTNVSLSASPGAVCPLGISTLTGSALVLGSGPQTLPSVNSYNAAGATPSSTGDDEIARVQIVGTTLNNVSSCTTTGSATAINTLPASILERYANYTNLPAPSLVAGTTYTVNMDLTNCGGTAYSMGYAVFMDLNRNGVWDMPAERVYGSPATVTGGISPGVVPVSFPISIPSTAAAGVTLMRVSAYESNAGSGFLPTTSSSAWGEVEDYQVNIISQVPIAGSGLSYGPSMDLASTSGASVVTNPLAAGTSTFVVTATDVSGCTATATTTVIAANPTITATASPASIILGNSSTLTASGGNTYVWVADSSLSSTTGSSVIATPTAIGTVTYTVTGTDINGCSAMTTVALTTVSPSSISLTSSLACYNLNTAAIEYTTSGFAGSTFTTTINPAGGLVDFPVPGVISNVGAGTYTVTVTDGSSTATSTIVVAQQASPLTGTVSSIMPACNGGNGTLYTSASGGSAPYLYTWFDATGAIILSVTDTLSSVASGTYLLLVEDDNACFYVDSFATLMQPAMLTITPTVSPIVCAGQNGSISWITSGGTGAVSVTVDGNASTSPYSGVAGTYTLVATDANGCTATATAVINPGPDPIVVSASASSILCNGGNATVTVSATGGTMSLSGTGTFNVVAGTYSYTVTDANGCSAMTSITVSEPTMVMASASAGSILCNGGTTTISVSGMGGTMPYSGTGTFTVTAGTYSYTVTDANGCSAMTSITVSEPTMVMASASAGSILCNGGSTSVMVSGMGGTMPYSGTGTFTVTAGTYSYTVTDANGCSAMTSITVTEPTMVMASASAGSILCNGGTTTISVSGMGGTMPLSGTGIFTVSAGSYSYTVTDANGCSAMTSITVSEPTMVMASASAGSILCNGGTTTISVSGMGGTMPLSGTGTFTVSAGTYSYTVTDANGCSAITSITVSEPTMVMASASAGSILCNGGSTSVMVSGMGGTMPYSGTGTFTVTAGTYSYTVTDANGCSAMTSITVSEPTMVMASASAGSILCNGGSTSVMVSGMGGTMPYSGTGSFTVTAGSYTYTVTDANGCSAMTSITITEPTMVMASASAGTILCNGGSTSVMVSGMGGTMPLSGTGTFTVNAGTYSYTVTDANGCTAITSISISEPSMIAIAPLASQIACAGGTGTISWTTTGGTGSITSMVNGVAATSPLTGVAAGTYTISATDANGCVKTETIVINMAPPALSLTLIANPSSILCAGGTAQLIGIASGGTPYGSGQYVYGTNSTNPIDSFIANVPVSPSLGYTVIATDFNGCTVTNTIIITQPTSIMFAGGVNNNVSCFGGSNGTTNISASGGTGSITIMPAQTGLAAGTYTFTATDANGCTKTTTVTITQPTQVSITASAVNPICSYDNGSAMLVTAGGTGSINTSPANTNLAPGTYTFTATDANGCTATASATLVAPAAVMPTVMAASTIVPTGGTVSLTVMPSGLASYSANGPGGISLSSTTNSLSGIVSVSNSGMYTITATNSLGCTGTTVINITVFNGSQLALRMLLNGPYVDTVNGLMHDSLRVLGLIPSTEPYSSAPYNLTYTHVNGGGGETAAASVFTVTGNNAIVDWVFVQLRSASNSSIVVETRSALIQRDGDIVDVDGVSPVTFPNSPSGSYFVSIEHRNHLGIMTLMPQVISSGPLTLDLTTFTTPLFTFPGKAGNPSPFTGAFRMKAGKRTMYAGNCNISTAGNAHRFITYNVLVTSDRLALQNYAGFTGNILGYSVYDVDLNGYARFNGLNPDRLIIYSNVNNSNTNVVNEQTPN
jgi:hypothetical protein